MTKQKLNHPAGFIQVWIIVILAASIQISYSVEQYARKEREGQSASPITAYQRAAAATFTEDTTSTQPSVIKTYTNSELGFIRFDYPGDFSLREERHTVEEATRYKVALLTVILQRTRSYILDRVTHEYTEIVTLSIYDLPEAYFHDHHTQKIIGNHEWFTSIQGGSESFMEALTSRGNYTYVFQLHSTKPQWLSVESPTTAVLERLLSTVSFQ